MRVRPGWPNGCCDASCEGRSGPRPSSATSPRSTTPRRAAAAGRAPRSGTGARPWTGGRVLLSRRRPLRPSPSPFPDSRYSFMSDCGWTPLPRGAVHHGALCLHRRRHARHLPGANATVMALVDALACGLRCATSTAVVRGSASTPSAASSPTAASLPGLPRAGSAMLDRGRPRCARWWAPRHERTSPSAFMALRQPVVLRRCRVVARWGARLHGENAISGAITWWCSRGFWQAVRRDPAIVGKTLPLGRRADQVSASRRPGSTIPSASRLLYRSVSTTRSSTGRSVPAVVGGTLRCEPAALQAELATVSARISRQYPTRTRNGL